MKTDIIKCSGLEIAVNYPGGFSCKLNPMGDPPSITIDPYTNEFHVPKEYNFAQTYLKKVQDDWMKQLSDRTESFLKSRAMKSPEQKITDLEKRQEEITKEITELKKELKPKERTLFQIRQDWQKTSSNVICKRDRERKVQSICDMIAVSDELNGDWEPDWKNMDQLKFVIDYNCESDKFEIISYCYTVNSLAYFESRELASKAITILGEEKIKLALS